MSLRLAIINALSVNINDKWQRTNYTIAQDKFFGVADHQLDVRYGMQEFEVIPHVYVRDWVDDWEDLLDKTFGFMYNKSIAE